MDNLAPIVKSPKESISLESLKDKPKEAQPEIKAEKLELSKNIQAFDARPRNIASPYDYNSISLAKRPEYTPTPDELITNPIYNSVGKFLGIDTLHEWGKNADKVKALADWAEAKTNSKDINSIMDFLGSALSAAPSFGMNHKRIDQLYMYAKINMSK